MQFKQRLLIAAGLMASLVPAQAFVQVRTLHDGWKVRNASSEIWHEAQVPGNLHLDLMRAHVIDDPFYRLNERSVQWIDKENWMYETYITPTEAELDAENQEIVFKGLDTYADIYLNSQRLVCADNMHREWRCNVKVS